VDDRADSDRDEGKYDQNYIIYTYPYIYIYVKIA
jgi:hypothetical protein